MTTLHPSRSASSLNLTPASKSFETSHVASPNTSIHDNINGNGDSNGNAADFEEKGISSPKDQEVSPEISPRPVTGWRWLAVLFAIYFTALLYGLDTTIVADIAGQVVEDFGSIEKLSWIGSAFPLGSIAVILSMGKAYGIFDNKWMFAASVLIFNIGSALCGAAPSMDALIVGRIIAGIGGAGDYLGALNLITRFTTIQERPLYVGLIGLSWGIGAILGPVIGGSFADSSATWRWSFYINLVGCGAVAPAIIFWIPSAQPQPGVSFTKKLAEMDWLGVLLNAGIYASWVIAITFGGALWAWSDGRTIATFVVCGVLIIAMALQQYFAILTTKERRIFPGEFLKRRSVMLLYFAMNAATGTAFIAIYFVPIYFQFVKGDDGLDSAVRLLPIVITFVFSIFLNGALMPLVGYYMPWYIAGGVLVTIGSSLMYTVTASTSTSAIYGYSALIGIGTGITGQAGYSVGAAKVVPHMIPSVIGLLNVGQIGAIVHCLAISGTVYQNYAFSGLKAVLGGQGFTEAEIRAAVAGSRSAVFTSLNGDLRSKAVEAIVDAIARTYIIAITGGAILLLCGLGMRREKLFIKPGVAA